MKAVLIGSSGHYEYALNTAGRAACRFVAMAPGSVDEDMSGIKSLSAGAIPLYEDYREMLVKEKPDVAVVNPRFYLISEVVKHCCNLHIHCFAEKPLALSRSDLHAIRELRGNTRIGMMMCHRYEPAFHAAFTAVKQGLIGTPLLMSVRKSYKMGHKPSWMQKSFMFGGMIPWVGAHAFDLIRWFNPVSHGTITAYKSKKGNRGMGDIEALATAILRFENDFQAVVTLDYLRPDMAATHADDCMRIAGEEGLIEVRGGKAAILTRKLKQQFLPHAGQPGIFEDFLASVRGKSSFRISEEDAFETAALYISASESASAHQSVCFT